MDGIGQAAERCRDGILLFLEHKNSEPAMKILMRNIGMTLHVIHKLRTVGLDNVKVNMDWQHLIMNGEIGRGHGAALLAAEGVSATSMRTRAGNVRRRQHGRSDGVHGDARARRGASGGLATGRTAVIGFDLYLRTEDAVAAVRRSVLHWRFIDLGRDADRRAGLARGTDAQDAVRAYDSYAALGAE